MNEKSRQRVAAVAQPVLQRGERIQLCSVANVGSVSVRRQIATAAVAGVLSGGLLMVAVRPKSYYLALTDRRLLFFGKDDLSGRPLNALAFALPLELLSSSDVKKGLLTTQFHVQVEGHDKALKMVFPLPARADAPLIASALGGRRN